MAAIQASTQRITPTVAMKPATRQTRALLLKTPLSSSSSSFLPARTCLAPSHSQRVAGMRSLTTAASQRAHRISAARVDTPSTTPAPSLLKKVLEYGEWVRRHAVVAAAVAAVALLVPASGAQAARSGGRIGGRTAFSSAARSGGGAFGGGSMGGSALGSRNGSMGGGQWGNRQMGGQTGWGSHQPHRMNNNPTATVHHHHHHSSGFGFGGWGGYGMGFGGGILSPVYRPFGIFGGGSSVVTFMLMAMMGVFMIGMLKNMLGGGGDEGDAGQGGGFYDGDDERMSVCRIQVGLLGSARDMQKDLERIADRADTSDADGLHYIMTETVLALMRNPEYWVYASCASASCDDPMTAEQRFSSLSMEERSKFQQETLSNVDSRRGKSEMKGDDAGGPGLNEYIVVTLLVAVDGLMRLPKVDSSQDLRMALNQIGGVGVDQVAAVEVLWTPQDENDTLTATEVLTDYPNFTTL